MSAFTPYKKVHGIESEPADLSKKRNPVPSAPASTATATSYINFPFDLSTVLLGLPGYHRNLFGISCLRRRHEEPQDKKEKFFIKNILKNDKLADENKSEKTKRKFEEDASEMETIVSNLGKSDGGHRCIYCGKIYSRKYGLKIHIRTHTGYKPLKCKYCLRPFGDPSNLNKHVRLHARGQTPYNCQLCGKILVRRRDLERHIKSKHGDVA